MRGELLSRVEVLARHSLVRFLVIGGLSAAIDTGLLVLLHGVLGVQLQVATLTAVMVSFGFNFTLNRIWAFNSKRPTGTQLISYGLLALANWGFTVVTVSALSSTGMYYLLAKLITLAIASALNYVGYRYWVFR